MGTGVRGRRDPHLSLVWRHSYSASVKISMVTSPNTKNWLMMGPNIVRELCWKRGEEGVLLFFGGWNRPLSDVLWESQRVDTTLPGSEMLPAGTELSRPFGLHVSTICLWEWWSVVLGLHPIFCHQYEDLKWLELWIVAHNPEVYGAQREPLAEEMPRGSTTPENSSSKCPLRWPDRHTILPWALRGQGHLLMDPEF